MLPQTNGDSNGPTVLVVGYDVDPMLVQHYNGHVVFKQIYDVRKPQDVPEGIRTVLTRKNLDPADKSRLQNLTASRKAELVERSESLVVLRQTLTDLFTSDESAQPSAPTPLPQPPADIESRTPDQSPPAEVLSEEVIRIRSVPMRVSDSVIAIVQKHVQYPCSLAAETHRLMPIVHAEMPDASESAVKQAVLSLLRRAGLQGSKPELSSSPTATVRIASAAELMTQLQKLMDDQAAFSANQISLMRDLQMRIKHLDGQADLAKTLGAENTQLQESLTKAREEARCLRDDLKAIGDRIGRSMNRTTT